MTHAANVWNKFCQRFNVLEQSVPLFKADSDGVVAHRMLGRTSRPILMRSREMEALILAETTKLVEDWESGAHRYDGLIYFMGWVSDGQFLPFYIGKTETIGKGAGNLSANIKSLKTDRSKFARWGDNYAYHIGDLSACVLPGHADGKQTLKYKAWADQLFESAPSLTPKLIRPVHFWATAWDRSMTGVWEELGPTSLAFLEYLLIGIAQRVSAELLNREGISHE
jgi:hypothetical protein